MTTSASQRTSANKAPTDRANRPKRVPVSGFRDLLTVYGQDPAFIYRWVSDSSDKGTRIFNFIRGGYVLVEKGEVQVGDERVYKTEDKGSVVAIPDGGSGNWLFLMKIEKDLYQEDQDNKMNLIDELEDTTLTPPNPNDPEGRYGPGGKISFK